MWDLVSCAFSSLHLFFFYFHFTYPRQKRIGHQEGKKPNQPNKVRPVDLRTQIGEKDFFFFLILKIQEKKAGRENTTIVTGISRKKVKLFLYILVKPS